MFGLEWLLFAGIVTVGGLTGWGGRAIYRSSPDEWNKTFARAAFVIRSNLGGKDNGNVMITQGMSKSAKNAIELANFQNTLEGKQAAKELVLADKSLHVIIGSWNELHHNYMEGNEERWFWECNCGVKEHRKTKEAAKYAAQKHIRVFGGRDENNVKEVGWLKRV